MGTTAGTTGARGGRPLLSSTAGLVSVSGVNPFPAKGDAKPGSENPSAWECQRLKICLAII